MEPATTVLCLIAFVIGIFVGFLIMGLVLRKIFSIISLMIKEFFDGLKEVIKEGNAKKMEDDGWNPEWGDKPDKE